ncbi:MAG: NAD(P)-binding domain-containing protein [Ignavibacteriales bacterium]|nr:NAD(P)-binding domain-containing protein [Ignavibacteriales bacterium]
MEIAIIGAGNVGGALGLNFAKKGHKVVFGTRDLNSTGVQVLLESNANISVSSINEAIKSSEVVLFSTPPAVAIEIAQSNPELRDKIVIDATNSVFMKPAPYKTAYEGIKVVTGCENIVKCFNSTGFENMKDPMYHGEGIDMFCAGNSRKAKEIATQLAKEIGFSECYDFGGDDKVELLEQFALCWINLAIIQKHGRDIAFKLIKR